MHGADCICHVWTYVWDVCYVCHVCMCEHVFHLHTLHHTMYAWDVMCVLIAVASHAGRDVMWMGRHAAGCVWYVYSSVHIACSNAVAYRALNFYYTSA